MPSRRIWIRVLLLLTSSPLTAFAQAETQPDQAPAPASPAPPPAEGASSAHDRPSPDSAYRHDGFYFRIGVGVGYGWLKGSGTIKLTTGDSGTDSTVTYKGWGPGYQLLFGGTVANGFVLGGGVVGHRLLDPKVTMNHDALRVRTSSEFDDIGEGAINIGVIGPFFDWFPRNDRGLHFGAMVGFALLGITNENGFAGSLWGGYDFWVSTEWSLGMEACLTAQRSQHSLRNFSGTLHDNALSGALLFSVLYN